MKKLLILIFLVFSLCSCEKYSISDSLFIASIGIEKKEDQYNGYFYLPLSSDIGKSENMESKGKGEFAKVIGKSVAELFKNIKATTSLNVNFKHVSSIVLNKELLTKEFLQELADYIKYSHYIDYNCYLFATTEEMDKIYDFQNPNQESVLNSILVSTSDEKGLFLVATPIHFLEFVSKFYAERTILLPLLDMEELWQVDGEKVKNSYCQSAVYYFKGNIKEVIKNPSSPYMKSTDNFVDQIKDVPIFYDHYKFSVKFKEKIYIEVKVEYQILASHADITQKDIQEYITSKIDTYINELKDFDILDLDYYNRILNANYNYNDYQLNIHFSTN